MRTSAWKHFSARAFTKRCHFFASGVASLISSNYPLAYVVSRESVISMNIDSDIFSRYLWRFACADERHSVAFHFFTFWKPVVRSTLNKKREAPLGNAVWRLSSLMALPLAPIFYHDSFQPLYLPPGRLVLLSISSLARMLPSIMCYAISLLTPQLLASLAFGFPVLLSEPFHVSLLFWLMYSRVRFSHCDSFSPMRIRIAIFPHSKANKAIRFPRCQ